MGIAKKNDRGHCHFMKSTYDIGDPPSRAPFFIVHLGLGHWRAGFEFHKGLVINNADSPPPPLKREKRVTCMQMSHSYNLTVTWNLLSDPVSLPALSQKVARGLCQHPSDLLNLRTSCDALTF